MSIPVSDPGRIRVLVTGSREWVDEATTYRALVALLARCTVADVHTVTVVHGAARGADRLAGRFASTMGLTEEAHPANWAEYGKKAGYVRNMDMLIAGRPDFAVAFKADFDPTLSHGGTENMVKLLLDAEIPTWVCTGPSSLRRFLSRLSPSSLPLDLSDALASDCL